MKLRRRISIGSMPSSDATTSIARSTRQAASGRPAPRYAVGGAVFVATAIAEEVGVDRGHHAVVRRGQAHTLSLTPAVHREHVLGPRLPPAHRTTESTRQCASDDVLGFGERFGAESTTHRGR